MRGYTYYRSHLYIQHFCLSYYLYLAGDISIRCDGLSYDWRDVYDPIIHTIQFQ